MVERMRFELPVRFGLGVRRRPNFARILLTIGDKDRPERVFARGHGSTLQLVEPKTSRSRRTVNLPEAAVRAFRAHKIRQAEERLAAGSQWQDGGLVFPNTLGKPLDPHELHNGFKALLNKAGLPNIRFHDLRHSAASLMLAQGIPLRSIQDILGHSSIALTANLYAHVGEQLRREAAGAMDSIIAGAAR
jgi:integrase